MFMPMLEPKSISICTCYSTHRDGVRSVREELVSFVKRFSKSIRNGNFLGLITWGRIRRLVPAFRDQDNG